MSSFLNSCFWISSVVQIWVKIFPTVSQCFWKVLNDSLWWSLIVFQLINYILYLWSPLYQEDVNSIVFMWVFHKLVLPHSLRAYECTKPCVHNFSCPFLKHRFPGANLLNFVLETLIKYSYVFFLKFSSMQSGCSFLYFCYAFLNILALGFLCSLNSSKSLSLQHHLFHALDLSCSASWHSSFHQGCFSSFPKISSVWLSPGFL